MVWLAVDGSLCSFEDLLVVMFVLSRHNGKQQWYLFETVITFYEGMNTQELGEWLFDNFKSCMYEPMFGCDLSFTVYEKPRYN